MKKNKKATIALMLIAVFLITGASTTFILVQINSPDQSSQTNTDSSDGEDGSNDVNLSALQNDENTQSEESLQPADDQSANASSQTPTAQGAQPTSSAPKTEQDNNDAARQALLDQIAANEREKQRIADELAAAQLEQTCNSIKTNMNSELKNAQTTYNNAISNMNCPSFGGCPAKTQAENNYNNSVASIKANYLGQWQTAGCPGNLY